jgi:hypothetical protein
VSPFARMSVAWSVRANERRVVPSREWSSA